MRACVCECEYFTLYVYTIYVDLSIRAAREIKENVCARDHIILSAAAETSLKYRSATVSKLTKYNNCIIIILYDYTYDTGVERRPNSVARDFNIISIIICRERLLRVNIRPVQRLPSAQNYFIITRYNNIIIVHHNRSRYYCNIIDVVKQRISTRTRYYLVVV